MRGNQRRLALPHWAVGVGLLVGGIGMAACGSGATSTAQQACSHVDRSIKLYEKALHASDPSRANPLAQQAYVQLLQALPLAARAASQNGEYQALMTTISESNRVSESHLITALRAQCAAASSSNHGEPPPPSSIPPPTNIPQGS